MVQPRRQSRVRGAFLLVMAIVGILRWTCRGGDDAFLAGSSVSIRSRGITRISALRAAAGAELPPTGPLPALAATAAQGAPSLAASKTQLATAEEGAFRIFGVDVPLLSYFALWYLGNYYYNITNKLALQAAGGAAGFPLTIATLQLAVGVLYAVFLWAAPDGRKLPNISFADWLRTLAVGFFAAGAHSSSVFAMSAGAVSFGQIVKAAEPAFAAFIGTSMYGSKVSLAKWLCLIPVIGGVVLASMGELDFAWAALIAAGVANVFAAFKGNENKRLMSDEGFSDRMGSIGNQFALTTINSFLFCLPLMIFREGPRLPTFFGSVISNPLVWKNLIASGLWFYMYNEVATMTMKKTSAVTQSVANTAKRVIVILLVAMVLGESLDKLKLIGCSIGIGGVFLYSIIDSLISRPQ